MHIVLPGELVDEVDQLIKRMREADPYGPTVSRTDAIRMLIVDGLKNSKAK